MYPSDIFVMIYHSIYVMWHVISSRAVTNIMLDQEDAEQNMALSACVIIDSDMEVQWKKGCFSFQI